VCQRVLDQEPELVSGRSPLIVVQNDANGGDTKSKRQKSLVMLFIGIVVLLAVGIGNGVGLGLKSRRYP
jgi:hypothetical protein